MSDDAADRDKSASHRDLEIGRACYTKREWASAFEALVRAQQQAPLAREDIERVVWSSALIGDDEAFIGALERLHRVAIETSDFRLAARAAFWIGFRLLSIGTSGRATGWLTRAQRYVEHEDDTCAERGYLLLPAIFRHLGAAEDDVAERIARETAEIGERCGDTDLVALARNLQGRALLRQGCIEPGIELLDGVMVAATSGELSFMVTGIVYCNVIATCQEVYALDRAREWTSALSRWCGEQPQLVNFTGNCMIHRSEIMQLAGAWQDAIDEIRDICERTSSDKDPEVFADACYQQGEIRRLRGEFDSAEAAYRLASRGGRDPQPGLALLRLAQGRSAEAAAAIGRVIDTTAGMWQRARMLPAFVEIMLAAGYTDRALAACAELESIARQSESEILRAMAAHARGAVLLAQNETRSAVEPLRYAFSVWSKVGAPYIAARIRTLLARAFRSLGDVDSAELELDAARRVFEELGAAPALTELSSSDQSTERARVHGLSPRELQVLRLIATGKSNKAVARELFVSERTVDRHVSNILAKLDVPSRAAATAFAYENDLI